MILKMIAAQGTLRRKYTRFKLTLVFPFHKIPIPGALYENSFLTSNLQKLDQEEVADFQFDCGSKSCGH